MKTIIKLTFQPLHRKRYRCNQTKEVTKNPKAYETAHYNKIRGEELVKERTLKNKTAKV
jgi:hypothetical protein